MMRPLKFFIIFVLFFILQEESLPAEEYVAFSLKAAQKTVSSEGEYSSEVLNLGGITAVRGLVCDRKTGDVILVGIKDPTRAKLTLDDFVVALRARFIHNQWPLVSIDPTDETKETNRQIVRFEGDIEGTQFGEDLFEADFRLKKIGMGLLPAGIPNLKTYWDLAMEKAKKKADASHKICSRFWFYPVLPSVTVREDVVSIKGLKVGVFTEVLSAEIDGKRIEDLSTFQDETGEIFAKGVSDNFEQLARVHPSFLRLQGLDELVALTKAIEEMEEKPDLSFWLKEYRVKPVRTEKKIEVLRRKEEYELPMEGEVYRGYQEVSGGVQLMAIALRLKAGDVTALKEAVLKTRPKEDALSWGFIIGEWLIPTSIPTMDTSSAVILYAHGEFLFQQKDYDHAIACWRKVASAYPEIGETYFKIGMAFERKGMPACAADYYTKALQFDPFLKNIQAKKLNNK
jgi:hypothetical protein